MRQLVNMGLEKSMRILQKIKKLKVHLNNSINKFVFKKIYLSQLKTEKGKIIILIKMSI